MVTILPAYRLFGVKKRRITIPRFLSAMAPVQVHDVEDAASWTQVQGTVTDDASIFSQGSHGIKLATTAGQNTPIARSPSGTFDLSAGTHIGFDCYVHETGTVNRTLFLVFWNNRGSNISMSLGSIALSRIGWNRIQLAKTAFTSNNGGSFNSTVTEIEVRLVGNANGQSVTVDNFQVLAPMSALNVNLHDTHFRHYDIAGRLSDKHGVRFTLTLPSGGTVGPGNTNKMSWDQVKSLYTDQKFDLVNHTQTHPDISAASQATVEGEISACDTDYVNNGLPIVPRFCAPNGADTAAITAAQIAQGKTFCLVTSESFSTKWPHPDHRRVGMGGTSTSNAIMISRVRTAWANKETAIMVCHDIASGGEATRESLVAMIEEAARLRIPILTIEDLDNLQDGSISVEVPW